MTIPMRAGRKLVKLPVSSNTSKNAYILRYTALRFVLVIYNYINFLQQIRTRFKSITIPGPITLTTSSRSIPDGSRFKMNLPLSARALSG